MADLRLDTWQDDDPHHSRAGVGLAVMIMPTFEVTTDNRSAVYCLEKLSRIWTIDLGKRNVELLMRGAVTAASPLMFPQGIPLSV